MNTGRTLALLHVIAPNQLERTIAVTDTPFCIGRTSHNDLILDDELVARRHACLRLEGRQVLLVDLGSETGTWLGQARLRTNEANVLNYQDIFKIGPYQLWLEPVLSDEFAPARTPAEVAAAEAARRAISPLPPIDPRLIESSPGGRVGVLLKTPQVNITPGSTTTVTLIVINQDSLADRFRIKFAGVPELWVSAPMPVVELPPGARQEINLVIAPPRTSENLAGQYTLLIQVSSQTDLAETVEVRATLTVTPYHAFSSSLQPPRIGVNDTARVVVRNDSNVQQRFALAWHDPERLFEFRPAETQMTLPPGQTAAVEFRSIPYKQRWFGGPVIKIYTVQVTGYDGQSQTHTGQIVTVGLLPTWVLPAFLTLILCTLGALLLSAGILASPAGGTATVTPNGSATATSNSSVTPAPTYTLLPTYTIPPTWTPPSAPTNTPAPAPTYTPLPTYTLPPTWTPPPLPTDTPLPPPPTWTPIPSPTFTATPTLTPTATSSP